MFTAALEKVEIAAKHSEEAMRKIVSFKIMNKYFYFFLSCKIVYLKMMKIFEYIHVIRCHDNLL